MERAARWEILPNDRSAGAILYNARRANSTGERGEREGGREGGSGAQDNSGVPLVPESHSWT